jgi:hypothetical protein
MLRGERGASMYVAKVWYNIASHVLTIQIHVERRRLEQPQKARKENICFRTFKYKNYWVRYTIISESLLGDYACQELLANNFNRIGF